MKHTALLKVFTLSLVLIAGLTGCKHKSPGVTYIPDYKPGVGEAGLNPAIGVNSRENSSGIPLNSHDWSKNPKDTEALKADIVYFDVDSAAVKSGEQSKLEAVAAYLKSNPSHNLIIEGHCDERGTEGYNTSLGEKRALALREYVIHLGQSADRIDTIGYGESKPADPGHNEGAWKKNRRGEFVVVLPAQ
ncbi:MAG: OmpA family protein [Limisphaerales bacterium]